jgi:NADH-quinone oxidoreductase subunit M
MFRSQKLYAVLSLSGIILGAWYMLWLVQRTFFGKLREPVLEEHGGAGAHADHPSLADLNTRELCALVPIVVFIVWIGIYPQFFIRRMEPSINQVMEHLDAGYSRMSAEDRPAIGYTPSAEKSAPAVTLSKSVDSSEK